METAGIRAATSVVGKALSPLSDGVLEAWAASTKLGSNMDALKMELLHAQGILNNAQGREIHNPALAELLNKLQHLAYGADDALDEIDYFRIQDELDGTYHAADVHAAGCVQDLALNAHHMARACVNKLKFLMCTHAARSGEQDDGGKQGCLSGLRSCGRLEIRSSQHSPSNQLGIQEVQAGCMPKATQNIGKHFSCFSFSPSVNHDAQTVVLGNHNMIGAGRPLQTPKLKFDRVEMSRKILEIIEQLKPMCAKVSSILSLELLNSSRTRTEDIATSRPETTPEIIEPKLYGRDSHNKIIADEIANGECCEITVLPIVGPGGIGKTTFTQHVYEQMKSYYEVPIWICVSLNFNPNRLVKDIVKRIPEVDNENKNCSDEDLIKQRLKGKRVLLVLDDVWKHHENEWKKLIALFKIEGVKGNMVIVTTRLPEVANTIKTTKCSLELEKLCPEDIMSLFEACVFGDQKPWVDHLELFDVGNKIVKKLKGSPLAAKTVGRLLRNKLEFNHWRSVLENKEWESQTDENDIMPALRLSYDYLPFHLQQCFSFCSLFPEDYEFTSGELVHLWIGLDIFRSCDQKEKSMEDLGMFYLNELVNHGFFKMNEKKYEGPYYVVHDLLHELAVKISSHECHSICRFNARDAHFPSTVRHLSIIVDYTDVKDRMIFGDYDRNLRALSKKIKIETLHTLMLFGDYHGSFVKTFGGLFKEATSLRIISLSGVSYNVEDILHNFSKLVHLRNLRMKSAEIPWRSSLPSSLLRLYHLEVLDLQNADACTVSTRHMSNLVKLRHFFVSRYRTGLHSKICQVGKLKFFQEIKEFRVGNESEGFELSQLGQLKEIGGSLGIYNLENVHAKEEASELRLIHKTRLRELILEWDAERSNKDIVQEENVLESLVPHSDLQKLCIRGHGGTKCPTWLCTDLSVKSIGYLCVDDVSWKNLPPLGGETWMVNEHGEEYRGCSISPLSFHNLKRLELSNISRLKRWVGNGDCSFFSHLEVLRVSKCSELIELPFSRPTSCQAQWEKKIGWFPKLRDLEICDCPKLESLPPIPWLTRSPWSVRIKRVGAFHKLTYPVKMRIRLGLIIEAKHDDGDVLWGGLNFSNLNDLEELTMTDCPPMPLDYLGVLTSLKKIEIHGPRRGSSSLIQVAGHVIMYRFPVEDLSIGYCATSGKELTLLLSFLPNLSKLTIVKCENITRIGVAEYAETVSGEQQRHERGEEEIIEGLLLLPPQLQELWLNCPNASLLSHSSHDDHAEAEAAGVGRGGGLQRLRSLRLLYLRSCPEFLSSYSSSSSSFSPFPTCLQNLAIHDMNMNHMDTQRALSNLKSLTDLKFTGCEGLRDVVLWPLLAHGHLQKLTLDGLPNFFACSDPSRSRLHDSDVFSRSSKLLLCMDTSHDTGFLDVPICSLFSSTLTRLDLRFDQEMERLTEKQDEAIQLLTSLLELQFHGGRKLQCLPAGPGLHKLIHLKKLRISCFHSIQSLPSFPSSLQELYISLCGSIKSLPSSLPSSLEILEIVDCKAIKSLPQDGLPSSMRKLDVHQCNSEELRRDCRKLIGTIPVVRT